MYTGDNTDRFPDNTDAPDLAWVSASMNTNFYPGYLYKNRPGVGSGQRSKNDVVYCPTDVWRRAYEAGVNAKTLIGYHWLPARAVAATYEAFGIKEWFYRKKVGGPYRNAPVMADAIECGGIAGQPYWNISLPSINYSGPSSNHPARTVCRPAATSSSRTATWTGSGSTATPTPSRQARKVARALYYLQAGEARQRPLVMPALGLGPCWSAPEDGCTRFEAPASAVLPITYWRICYTQPAEFDNSLKTLAPHEL